MSISPREQVADNLADLCVFGGLNDSYGVSKIKTTKDRKSFWAITFCKARVLDGVINVYSPNFILIKWMQGRTRQQQVLKSEQAAKEFLIANFIKDNT
jgi:hypothetical protein